jgi:hypothetical protein
MNTIKQPSKGTMFIKGPDITQLFKNKSSRNVIKSVINLNLHRDSITVVEEGSDAKRDGLTTSKG